MRPKESSRRFAPDGLRSPSAHPTLVRLLAVDAAVQPVLGAVPRTPVLRATLDGPLTSVVNQAGIDQTFAKPLAVIRGGVHHDLAPDDPVLLVDAYVRFVAVN